MLSRTPKTEDEILTPLPIREMSSYQQSLICKCSTGDIYGPFPPQEWIRGGWYPICSQCRKPHWHKLHQCVSCSDIFLKDFRHPGWNWKNPKCWECLEREDPDFVCDEWPAQKDPCKIPSRTKTERQFLQLAEGPSVFSWLN